MQRMNPEVKALWLAELRSGEHTQAATFLHKTDDDGNTVGMCCLGVLCLVAAKSGLKLDVQYHHKAGCYKYNTHDAALPHEVMEWAGITSCVGRWGDGDATLAAVNDRSHQSDGKRHYETVIPYIEKYF